ncbi:16S rRNA (guanine(966)-N(2))-methyltransferase RsmD [Thermoanaerobacter thermohydrosulfuricus]|jgi:16S rRNA (guanine(966)-N(2))-methyltransferase RsmD|uniref:16S rRNA (guanine(966)-N(2))-methyltransferase RsmD n=1 Tax=Thermoanaerobacter thermohydrosulfuricus TaxID=1516 RepID=UPI00225DED65|nr:16S rRNA (guanine(966)-N(2))-methyltransferase RsmD [Thermoanaerobacter thermohydrosulfuricus]
MSLRVIAGKLKGRKVKSLEGNEVRPTADRVKESLFNILMNKIEGSIFLDLFAGTGNIGIEALSRGAQFCYFVDKSLKSIKCIRENVTELNLVPFAKILHRDVLKVIEMLDKNNTKFDIIFLDPPYYQNLVDKTLIKLGEAKVLKEDGIIIAEHHKNDKVRERYGNLVKIRENKYGETILSFYKEEI